LPKGGAFGVMKPVDMELLLKLAEAQDSEGGDAGLCSTSSWSSSTSAGAKKTRSMILKDLGLTEKNGARGRIKIENITKSFDPRKIPVYLAAVQSKADIKVFATLSQLLAPVLDDEAKTSYTSHFDEGLFWSGLVEAHPEFIDCVCEAEDHMVQDFLKFLNFYYMYHFLTPAATSKEKKATLFSTVRKRDRPSVLAWLCQASHEERRMFKSLAKGMLKSKDSTEGYSKSRVILEAIIYQDRDVLELLSRIGKEEAKRAKEAAYKAKGQLARRASSTGLQGLVPNWAQNGTADRTETQVENVTSEELAIDQPKRASLFYAEPANLKHIGRRDSDTNHVSTASELDVMKVGISAQPAR